MAEKVFTATGRRKTSVARVFLRPGKGKITINDKRDAVKSAVIRSPIMTSNFWPRRSKVKVCDMPVTLSMIV